MNQATPQLYLASSSPRRRELLAQIGVRFEVLTLEVEEVVRPGERPAQYVQRAALDKALAGWRSPQRRLDCPVLGSDTEVVLDGQVLGKPADREHAVALLQRLAGRSHEVLSAVALVQGERQALQLSRSVVHFRRISMEQAEAYWHTGEPADKAGGYAIQGCGAVFVEHLEGSFSGVMGLPLFETAQLLAEFGVAVL